MSLFSKKICCRCGKESRLMPSFESRNGTVHLCDKCQEELHVPQVLLHKLTVFTALRTML